MARSEDKLQVGPVEASWEVTYLSDAKPDNAEDSPFRYDVGEYTVHDFQLGLGRDRHRQSLCRRQQRIGRGRPDHSLRRTRHTTGADTAADVYDPIGRARYVGFRIRN